MTFNLNNSGIQTQVMVGIDTVGDVLDEYTCCEFCGDELGTGHDGGNGPLDDDGTTGATVADYRSQPEMVTCKGDAAAAWHEGRPVHTFTVTESAWPAVVITGTVVLFEDHDGTQGMAGHPSIVSRLADAPIWVSEPLDVKHETALKQSMWRYNPYVYDYRGDWVTRPVDTLFCSCGGYTNDDTMIYDGTTVSAPCTTCGETVEVYA